MTEVDRVFWDSCFNLGMQVGSDITRAESMFELLDGQIGFATRIRIVGPGQVGQLRDAFRKGVRAGSQQFVAGRCFGERGTISGKNPFS
jgi:hypothetical protein